MSSVSVHVPYQHALILRADVVHASTVGYVHFANTTMPRLHGVISQIGGYQRDLSVRNFYEDVNNVSFTETHHLSEEHKIWFPRQTRVKFKGGEIITDHYGDFSPTLQKPPSEPTPPQLITDVSLPARKPPPEQIPPTQLTSGSHLSKGNIAHDNRKTPPELITTLPDIANDNALTTDHLHLPSIAYDNRKAPPELITTPPDMANDNAITTAHLHLPSVDEEMQAAVTATFSKIDSSEDEECDILETR